MGSGCCGQNIQINQDIKMVKRSKLALRDEVMNLMKNVINNGGPTMKLGPDDMRKCVTLYNEWFDDNISPHSLNDCRLAVMNMKALYHQLRRNEIEIIEDQNLEDIIDEIKAEEFFQAEQEIIEKYSKPEQQLLDAEGEQINKDKFCVVCNKKLHWNSKSDKCKECK